ncbi:MAG: S-layer homology domain-containing protein [Bacillus sp. (in: firmicutes)]
MKRNHKKSLSRFTGLMVTSSIVATALAPTGMAAVQEAKQFKDVAPQYKEAVQFLLDKGATKGLTDTKFGVYDNITRQDAAVQLVKVLGLEVDNNVEKSTFKDVPNRTAKYVDALVKAGITNGKTKTTFGAADNITRGELAIWIAKGFELEGTGKVGFKDVNKRYVDAVSALVENKITKGMDELAFGTDRNATRGQFAIFLQKADAAKTPVAKVEAVKAENGKVTVTLDKEVEAAKVEDFKVTQAIDGKPAVSVTPTAVKLGDDKKTVELNTPEVAKTDKEQSVVVSVAYGKGEAKSAEAFKVEVNTPVVTSVTAINAKQIVVKFNTAVDKATAQNVANYAIKPAGQTAVMLHDTQAEALTTKGYATAKLADDNKTLTITLGQALTSNTATIGWTMAQGDVFNLEYNLVTAAGETLVKGTESVKFEDKVAPTLVSATSSAKTTTNTVVLKFSEPVDFAQATVAIDGKYATLTAGSTLDTVIATFANSMTAGQTYSAQVLNIKDAAGNQISPNPVTATFTVSADATAPSVTNVTVVRDNLVEVTFDKSMNVSTVTAAGALKLVDANLNSTGITTGTVTVKANTDNKTFLIPVNALPFNATGNFTGLVSVANTVQDSAGNAVSASTTAVSVKQDSTAPTVVSATYKKLSSYGNQATANGSIVVTFDESIKAGTSAGVLVYDQDGASVSTPFGTAVVNPLNDKELILPLSAATTNTQKSFTVVLPAGTGTDNTIIGNASVAKTVTVDVSAGAVTGADTTAPTTGASASVTAAVLTPTATGNKITVTFNESGSGIDVASVLEANNYRLNGAPLPSGSYITQSTAAGVTTAVINLPFGTTVKSENYSLNINGVKDKVGNVITPAIYSVVLVDDVQPELKAGNVNADGTLSLTFSERVTAANAANLDDLEFHLNGKQLTSAGLTVAAGAGSDAGKYVITVPTKVDNIADGSISPGSVNTLYIDVDNSNTFNTGDIIISQVAAVTGTADDYTAATFNLNNATSLVIKTIASPLVIKDESAITNPLKGNTTITVK